MARSASRRWTVPAPIRRRLSSRKSSTGWSISSTASRSALTATSATATSPKTTSRTMPPRSGATSVAMPRSGASRANGPTRWRSRNSSATPTFSRPRAIRNDAGALMIGVRMLRAVLAALAVLSASAAFAAEPDFALDLDTGGHRAFIKDIAFSADGQYLVSASDDKTIRVWDWESGLTLRTLRGYFGSDNDGKIFAVAISPDGKTIAAGGYFGAGGNKPPYGDVRLFDFQTGTLKAPLHGPNLAVYDVAFSPDGALLAAGGQDGYVFVWQRDDADPSGWKAFAKLDADSTHIQKVAFAEGGKKLAATTTDNGIRLW